MKKNKIIFLAIFFISIISRQCCGVTIQTDVIKAVVPAAGFGTRFLPFTKSVPKEMLPILNKPAIQYVIEEGLDAGISNYLMITSKSKYAVENYFDSDKELEIKLEETNRGHLISSIKNVVNKANFTYIRQPEALGLGHAVLMAKHCIGKEYFAVILPDDIVFAQNNALGKMIDICIREKATVIMVVEVPLNKVSSYGIVAIEQQLDPNVFEISDLVEKPKQEDAPSCLAIVGRYILSHKLFDSLETIWLDNVGELQLTDGIRHMMQNGERVIAYKFDGVRYDIGTPLGWLKMVIGMSLQDPYYGPGLRKILLDSVNL